MTAGLSLTGLEDIASGEDTPRRSAILSALTQQYLELEPRLSDRHIELYDNVFKLLVSGIELQARVALSERLAPLPRAPRDTVRKLARDDYAAVAAPVLKQSPLLDEIDLIEVARNKTEAHRAALAGRANIAVAVTNILVERREQSVFVELVQNDSARLSADGAVALASMAQGNPVVAQALAARLQIPATALSQILEAARSAVVDMLIKEATPAEAEAIEKAVDAGVDVVASLPEEGEEDLTDQQIVALMSMHKTNEVAAALAKRTDLPLAMMELALKAFHVDGLLIALKAAGFRRAQAEGMIAAKLGVPVGSALLFSSMDHFDRIKPTDPYRMIEFVLHREKLRVAI